MAYAVVALWTAKEGAEDEIQGLLLEIASASRAEPGCRLYRLHRARETPRSFLIYEMYDDQAAFEAHVASEHFVRLVLGRATPVLEQRERSSYDSFGD